MEKLDKAFWHLCTAEKMPVIFRNEDEFRFGMNIVAACCSRHPEVKVIAFILMNNHIHMALFGEYDEVRALFDDIRQRIKRHCASEENMSAMEKWDCKIIRIGDARYLRNTIVYIHRNGYVANKNHTPYSYPWGTGPHYFNISSQVKSKVGDLTVREKRELFRSRDYFAPDSYLLIYGYVAPESFCDIALGMGAFVNAHQYFSDLTKNVEAYAEIAREFQEDSFMCDDEIFLLAAKICRQKLGVDSFKELNPEGRIQLARILHYEYHSGNSQIARVTGIPERDINSMFPLSAKK